MVSALLLRGMVAGLLAGLIVFGFGKVFGEPQVDRAIAFETALDEAKAKAEMAKGMTVEVEPEIVSRGAQASIGLFTGVVVYCAAFGGLFALVFAYAYGRAGSLRPRMLCVLLAAAGFVAIYVAPNLKYPANPPSVGQPDTIGIRTGLYFVMMALSIAAMTGAVVLGRRLAPRHGVWSATLIAGATYIVVIFVAQLLLPAINEVPEGFPAVVLWRFRIASLGMQLVMWTTLGLVFGALAEKLADPRAAPARRRLQGVGAP